MKKNDDAFDGVVGGEKLSSKFVREEIVEPTDLIAASELDRKMIRLLALHPELQVKFRNNNLANLDEATKEALLKAMYDVLDIVPLHNG